MRELTEQFVLATDEVWRLQGGSDPSVWRENGGTDPECIAFQDMSGEGHYGPGAGSKQGIYVCTPAGEFLASVNSSRPESVIRMLRVGLTKWHELSAQERAAKPRDVSGAKRLESLWPKGGLSLSVTMRYLPADDDPSTEKGRDYNHDFLWFTADEARQFLPAKPVLGAKHTLPARLFERVVRLNLVDAVRGETRPFESVEGTIEIEVTKIEDGVVELRLAGRATARRKPGRRRMYVALGVKAELLGYGRYDLEKHAFVALDWLGKGVRWAENKRRRRGRSSDSVRSIGWRFSLTPAREDGFYVAPTHIRDYRADWVR